MVLLSVSCALDTPLPAGPRPSWLSPQPRPRGSPQPPAWAQVSCTLSTLLRSRARDSHGTVRDGFCQAPGKACWTSAVPGLLHREATVASTSQIRLSCPHNLRSPNLKSRLRACPHSCPHTYSMRRVPVAGPSTWGFGRSLLSSGIQARCSDPEGQEEAEGSTWASWDS